MIKRLRVSILLLILLFSLSAAADPFTGIQGRAARDGQTVEGVKVFVFESVRALNDCVFMGRSEVTDVDGLYSLSLPPGTYWVVGYGGRNECPVPSEGELFCFYGGNPVVVERGKPTNVGLNMVKVSNVLPPSPSREGITGYVFDESGEPLESAVAYFYKNPSGGLRGIPDYFTRTNRNGMFRARIGKGTYYIVARKRQGGEMFGPTQIGDHFGYYPNNPVSYDGTSRISIRIDAVPRLSQLEKFEGFEQVSHGIKVRGVIRDAGGNPVPDYYVFAYRGDATRGMPESISGKSDRLGNFELTVYRGGAYRLVARKRPGGPALDEPTGEREVRVEDDTHLDGVTITIRRSP